MRWQKSEDASIPESYEEILDLILTINSKDDVSVITEAQPQRPTVLEANIEGFVFNPVYLGTNDF